MRTERTYTVKRMEEILLFVYTMTLGCQMFAVKTSRLMQLLGNMGWCLTGAGIFFVAGYRAAMYLRDEIGKRELLQLALLYYGMYVLTGFGRFVLIDQGSFWDDLMRVVFLVSVPKFSEVFFTAAALLVLIAVGKNVYARVLSSPLLAVALSVAGFGLVFFPQSLIRYPILTMWIGGDSYRCLPLMVYLGYFMLGGYLAGEHKRAANPVLIVFGSVYTIVLVCWHRAALVKSLEFPLHYWAVLLPAGLLLLLTVLVRQKKVMAWYEKLRTKLLGARSKGDTVGQTMILLLILHVLRGVFQVKKYSSLRTAVLCIFCWAVSVMVLRMVKAWQTMGVKGFCQAHKKFCYIVAYTIGFVVVFSLVYLPFLENGASLIWRRDAISQYFPKAMYYARYMRETVAQLLQGNFAVKMYDFSLGMGDSVPVKLEPLYWLHALFKPEDMEAGYEFVMVLRMYLSGLSVSALLLYLKKDEKITWICSYIYCFSGYVLYACTRHAQFMVPFILLPLLVIAVEEIIRKKRWIPGCILIAVSLLCSYYFLYMNTIALAVYFLVRYAFLPKTQQTWKNFWSYIGCFAGAYILGVGMGSMTIFTSLFNYFGSARTGSGNISAESLWFYKKDWLNDLYVQLIAPGEGLGYWMKLGFIPVVLLAIVALYLRKNKKELKVCMAACLAGLLFPAFAYFMSGFGSVTNRWLYIFTLVLTLAAAEFLAMIPSLTKKELSILFMALVPYFVLTMFYSRYDTVFSLKGLGMLLMTYIIVVFSAETVGILGRRQMLAAMGVLVILGLAMNGDMLFGTNGAAVTEEYAERGKAVEEAETTLLKACTDLEDDSFYRVTEQSIGMYNYCASSAMGLNSISYFNSTMNGLILEFDQLMGNGRSCMVYQSDFNNRTILNALAAVKYYGSTDDETAEAFLPYGYQLYDEKRIDGTGYTVYKTEDTLPLAYSYERVMSQDELLAHPVEERQELLLKNAVVEDTDVLTGTYDVAQHAGSGYRIQPKEIILDEVSWDGNDIVGSDNGKVTFVLDKIPNAEIYFVFTGTTTPTVEGRDTTLLGVKTENGEYEYRIRPEENIYHMDFEKYMINFGYSKEGHEQVTLQFWGSGILNLDDWMLWCQPMDDYAADVNALKEDALENIVMENNQIRGTISTEKEKLLTFSIPYQKGWSATVDGVKVPLLKTNIMYTGLEISPGEHTVVLQYEMPGIRYGFIVTGISTGIFICILIGFGLRKRKKVKSTK